MYTHCCNYILNLVISTSSQLPVIRNAMATISDRDNYPSDDPEHFFREAIFVPYLNHLIVEKEDRFFYQKQKCRKSVGLDT